MTISANISFLSSGRLVGFWRIMLLQIFIGLSSLIANTFPYGSGTFILNDEGDVYSNSGGYIGYSYEIGSVTVSLYNGGTLVNGGFGGPVVRISLLPYPTNDGPHTIELTGEHGSISKSSEQENYDFDSAVTLTAIPDEGYIFSYWSEGPGLVFSNNLYYNQSSDSQGYSLYSSTGELMVSSSPTFTVRTVTDLRVTAHFMPITRIIALDGSYLTWSQQVVGESSYHNFTIKNDGNSPLNITDIVYPAGFSGHWSGIIAPGGNQTVNVIFTPPSAGTFTGDIVVHSNATSGPATLGIHAVGEKAFLLEARCEFHSVDYNSEIPEPPVEDGWSYASPIDVITPSISKSRFYWQNSVVDVKARPVSGYIFRNWMENGNVVSTSPDFTLNIIGDHDLEAHYLPIARSVVAGGKVNFGERQIRTLSKQVITLKNYGNSPVFVTGLIIKPLKGDRQSAFRGQWSGWIYPHSSQKVAIRFKPTKTKKYRSFIGVDAPDQNATINGTFLTGSGK